MLFRSSTAAAVLFFNLTASFVYLPLSVTESECPKSIDRKTREDLLHGLPILLTSCLLTSPCWVRLNIEGHSRQVSTLDEPKAGGSAVFANVFQATCFSPWTKSGVYPELLVALNAKHVAPNNFSTFM
jgi:hypothetical protein